MFSARKSDHITPLLRELHCLKVPGRIQFRLCVLAYRCLIGTAPSDPAETLHLTADVGSGRRLRSASAATQFSRIFPDNCYDGCSFVFNAAARLVFSARKS